MASSWDLDSVGFAGVSFIVDKDTSKMPTKSSKGGQFERDTCRQLSLWWSGGKRDDIFWRTSGSGARATVRSKKGKTTDGSHGDIMAVHPSGRKLLKVFTFELKRGYSKYTIFDLMDRLPKAAEQEWYKWWDQAMVSHKAAGSLSPALITCRNRRQPILFVYSKILGDLSLSLRPCIVFQSGPITISGVRLNVFLHKAYPNHIKYLADV